MYEVKIEEHFAAAHNLRGYQGQCEALHGHNWKVEVVVRADRLDDTGLALDFQDLKQATREVLARLDHAYLNELEAFREHNPSSERIAEYVCAEVARRIDREGVRVHRVTAWESNRAAATFIRD
ncbi:6-carboxytetrahydropterin synthase QueD [Deferrisoma camini]|uniref:6-carboxytetrahydropterin synthase QueD n=1 Tax=Deferrisoma camini TaxID=1035120 RepID=UPI00046D7DEE|nr:6-carboxytetrahydropterin synthase QueD [Deferrisoma camini]